MLGIIWWVVVAGIVTAGGDAVVSVRKSVFGADGTKAIADSAAKCFVPQVVRDFLADPGAAIKGQVAGAQQNAIEAVKNEIADLFNIATATPFDAAQGKPFDTAEGKPPTEAVNSASGAPCVP